MIFIAVKFTVRPELSEKFVPLVAEFTDATRQESGNVFFEWSRSVEDPNQFVLLEGFESPEAGQAHVESEHFKTAMAWISDVFAEPPQVIHVETSAHGWAPMGEFQST